MEPVRTGRTEYCPTCQTNKAVVLIAGKHFVEPCSCDIKREREEKEKFLRQQQELLKIQISKLFPLDDETETLEFSNFIQRKGSENVYKYGWEFAHCYTEKYKEQGIGLLFTGTYGNGKTRMVKTILKYRSRWNTVIYTEYVNLFDRIMTAIKKKEEDPELLYKCLINCDVLAVDDIGVGEVTHAKERMLLKIIDSRMSLKKPILFTMNPEGESQLSPRILSRIDEICIPVINNATDFRSNVLQMKLKGEETKDKSQCAT